MHNKSYILTVKVRNADDVMKLNLILTLRFVGKMIFYTLKAHVKNVTANKNKSLRSKIKLKLWKI